MSTAADRKLKIVNLYAMGLSFKSIAEKITNSSFNVKEHYVKKVVDEYENDGTISVNSRLNKIA